MTKKHKTKKKLKEKTSGITLIALVVTVIVILILAGISIGMLTGNNGIINQASNAKEQANEASILENIELAITRSDSKYGDIDKSKLITNLEKIKGLTLDKDHQFPLFMNTHNNTYAVLENGDVKKVNKGEALYILKHASEYYGKYVTNYAIDVTGDDNYTKDWQILYSDGENIYLIAEYLFRDKFPTGRNGKDLMNNSYYNNATNFNAIVGDTTSENRYIGAEDIIDTRLKNLNKDFFYKYSKSTNRNMKAVSYMMDTSVWNPVLKTEQAEYGIASPTIELIIRAYNSSEGTNYQARVSENGYGYEISIDGGENWANLYNNVITNFIKGTGNYGYWLASPSSSGEYLIMRIRGSGTIDGYKLDGHGNIHSYLRPVVCLKSDYYLESHEDGTYTIEKN